MDFFVMRFREESAVLLLCRSSGCKPQDVSAISINVVRRAPLPRHAAH